MERAIWKALEDRFGHVLQLDPSDVSFNPVLGHLRVRNVSLKAEAFDKLYLPCTLRSGFLEEFELQLPFGVVFGAKASLKVTKLYLLAGPVTTDWLEEDDESVMRSKSRLIDMVNKIWESQKKADKEPAPVNPWTGLCAHMWGDDPVAQPSGGGSNRSFSAWLGRARGRFLDVVAQKMVGSIDIEIKDIHLRFEDAVTQAIPVRLGFKVRGVYASSECPPASCRATGDWKHVPDHRAKPILQVAMTFDHVSAYWDQNTEESRLMLLKHDTKEAALSLSEVIEHFTRLKVRGMFSARVIEQLELLFPPKHPRRKKRDVGPTFRDRYDYHRYVLVPARYSMHLAINSSAGGMIIAGAYPAVDVDCQLSETTLIMDTNQLQSANQYLMQFGRYRYHAEFLKTRPLRRISECRDLPPSVRTRTCRQWWQHALHGISLAGLSSHMRTSHFRTRNHDELVSMKSQYIDLWSEASVRAAYRETMQSNGQPQSPTGAVAASDARRVLELQVRLPVHLALDWRILAIRTARQNGGGLSPRLSTISGSAGDLYSSPDSFDPTSPRHGSAWKDSTQRSSLASDVHKDVSSSQLTVQLDSVKAYFFASSRDKWTPDRLLVDYRLFLKKRMRREPIVGAAFKSVSSMMVIRGRTNQRTMRWFELSVGELTVTNEKALHRRRIGNPEMPVRDMFHIEPFEQSEGHELCFHLAANSLVTYDESHETGDVPPVSIVYPAAGVAAHLGVVTVSESELRDRLKFVEAQDRSLEIFLDGKFCNPLGAPALDVEVSGGSVYIRSLNGAYPQNLPPMKDVKIGQVIVEVNGRRNAAAMIEELKKPYFLSVKLRRDGLFRDVNFVYIRAGRLSALDYTPYRERLVDLFADGSLGSRARSFFDEGLITKIMALDKELLVRLQRLLERYSRKMDSLPLGGGTVIMSSMVEGELDGALLRQVTYYNKLNVLCKELILPPTRWQTLQSACPHLIHVRVQGKGRDAHASHRRPLPGAKVNGLMAWKINLQVLAREDFYMGLEVDILDCFGKRLVIPRTHPHGGHAAQNAHPQSMRDSGSGNSRPSSGSSPVSPRMSSILDSQGHLKPTSESRAELEPVVNQITYFHKFGKGGTSKGRYLRLDRELKCLVWTKAQGDPTPAGCLPLEKIQDVIIGVQTPVMIRARKQNAFNEKCVFSIVACDRTLDLQGRSESEVAEWVAALRQAYFDYFEALHVGDLRTSQVHLPLPKNLTSKIRVYPENLRHMTCALKVDCRKITTLLSHDAAMRLR